MSNTRERDLVLAPNEYAYISDQTKGHIVAYVGPYKTSMANTDQPVYFDEADKQFKICGLDESIKSFTIVPEGWYVTLKNPPKDEKQPTPGTANSLTALNVGRKINIPGPDFFALWPGQMVRVILGHRLRSNQYLIVRVYEEDEAKKNWGKAIIKAQNTIDNLLKEEVEVIKEVIPDSDIPDLSVGKLLVIKGSNVSFYIPPTGVEIVRDIHNNYVRDAITLERLEYCILLDENGNKRYIQGPDVVIPEPTETFYVKDSQRKFKAIELNEISGIYVKVIAPYTEGGKKYTIGKELFITGKDQMIYFPRLEHALIKYGEHEIYHAVAIPPGEGRYYLNRKTGQVSLKKGPCMFLPDPREAVIAQRILTEKQANLWYPGNKEVLNYNAILNKVASKTKADRFSTSEQLQQSTDIKSKSRKKATGLASDEFVRDQSYTTARTITLDTKYQGAVTIEVWTGYAVLVIGKTGIRKVIAGPQTYLLEYDENLAVMELSTKTPKTDENLIRTVYLRVLHNKVSDIILAESKDLCPIRISLSYRVNFSEDPDKWFNVENYVKFLTDHMRSVVRNAVKKQGVVEFYSEGIDILRNTILGISEDKAKRKGRLFKENGMHIYDVEIFDISLDDSEMEDLLFSSQHDEVKQKLEISAKHQEYEFIQKEEKYNRKIAIEKSISKHENIELQLKETEKQLIFNMTRLDSEIKSKIQGLNGKLSEQEIIAQINAKTLEQEKASKELNLEISQQLLQQDLERINAEVDAIVNKSKAITPDFIAALQAFGDKALAEKMAETMAPLAIIGGKSIADVFAKLLKGTTLENVLNSVMDRS